MTETTIGRPLEIVASYAADPSNAPQWYENILSVEWRTEPPVQLGSEVAFVARFLGRTLRYTYRVTDYLPHERLVMRTEEGPFPMETTYTWTAEGSESTRMTLRNRGRPSGFSRLAAPILERAMRRATGKDLASLRSILEGGD